MNSAERLTFKDAVGEWAVPGTRFDIWERLNYSAHVKGEPVRKLADYENTELTPKEITSMQAELADLRRKKEAGLIVELPCEFGTTVYVVSKNPHWRSHSNFWEPEEMKTPEWVIVKEQFSYMHLCYLNKTVFLTREAAEAALQKKGADNG